MDDGVRKWIARTARENFWRVQSFYEIDDLIQDGYICYMKVRSRYPQAKKPAHIMRLLQVTFKNHIQDLARRRTIERRVMETEAVRYSNFIDPESHALFQSAPDYVKEFFRFVLSDASKKLRTPYGPNYRGRGRETTHERLCRFLALKVAETPELPHAIIKHIEQ